MIDALMRILKINPVTSFWPIENLNGLLRQSVEAKFTRSHTFYNIGEPSDTIYFIKDGEVEVKLRKDSNNI